MPILPAEFNPTYSFIVNNLDYTAVYSSNLPDDNLENVIEQLKSTSFMIEGVGKVKYGDKFTLSGPNAVRVKNLYVGTSPKVLEIFTLPNVTDLEINFLDDVQVDWTANSDYMTEIGLSEDNITWTTYGFAAGVHQATFEGVAAHARARFVNNDGAYSPTYTTVSLSLPIVTTDDIIDGISQLEVYGTVVVEGSSDLLSYGFVWATHNAPTLDDNVIEVDTGSFTGNFSHTDHAEYPIEELLYFAAYATNSSGTSYGSVITGTLFICLMEGTLVTLANGDKKKIENITYKDDLLVWDFDNASLAVANPVWLVQPFENTSYALAKFSDGSELCAVNDGKGHRIFNKDKNQFIYIFSEDTPIGSLTINELGENVSLVSKEIVNETVKFYNVITHTHFNVFANNLLTSTGLNNLYPIENMKFIKDDRTFSDKTYFDVSSELYNGLRLAEQLTSLDLISKIHRMKNRQNDINSWL